MTQWHGWTRTGCDVTVCVGPLPGRKRFAAYVEYNHNPGASINAIAYFKTEQAAAHFLDALDTIFTFKGELTGPTNERCDACGHLILWGDKGRHICSLTPAAALYGQWPGDESEEELLTVLEEMG